MVLHVSGDKQGRNPMFHSNCAYYDFTQTDKIQINRIYDGVEAKTRKSQASFQII